MIDSFITLGRSGFKFSHSGLELISGLDESLLSRLSHQEDRTKPQLYFVFASSMIQEIKRDDETKGGAVKDASTTTTTAGVCSWRASRYVRSDELLSLGAPKSINKNNGSLNIDIFGDAKISDTLFI
jgi:hypothetical protein